MSIHLLPLTSLSTTPYLYLEGCEEAHDAETEESSPNYSSVESPTVVHSSVTTRLQADVVGRVQSTDSPRQSSRGLEATTRLDSGVSHRMTLSPPRTFFRSLCALHNYGEKLIRLEETRYKSEAKWRRSWKLFEEYCLDNHLSPDDLVKKGGEIQKILAEFAIHLQDKFKDSPSTPRQILAHIKSSLQLVKSEFY